MTPEEMHQTIGRIDANVTQLLNRDIDTEKRLRTVEKRQWWQSGVAAAIAFIAAKFG